MVLLGLETTTRHASVALADEQGLIASARTGRGGRHGEFVAPAIDFCRREAGIGLEALTGVAVSLGPGLFTGMRVGIATAQAIAHARGLPVVGLASLDLVAFGARHTRRRICAVIDARRGEVAWAHYEPAPGGVQRRSEPRLGAPERLAGELEDAGGEVLCVGDGALAHRSALEATRAGIADEAAAYPSAESLLALARPRFARGETSRPEELAPLYLRRPDARLGWQQRGALHGGVGGAPAVVEGSAGGAEGAS